MPNNAVFLALSILFVQQPDMPGLFRVLAAQEDSQEIAFFQTLPDEVSNQTVLLGTPVEELYLPDTLEAVVLREQEKEDVEDSEDGEIKDEDKLPRKPSPDEDKTDEKDELGGLVLVKKIQVRITKTGMSLMKKTLMKIFPEKKTTEIRIIPAKTIRKIVIPAGKQRKELVKTA